MTGEIAENSSKIINVIVPFGTDELGLVGYNYVVFDDEVFSLLLKPLFDN